MACCRVFADHRTHFGRRSQSIYTHAQLLCGYVHVRWIFRHGMRRIIEKHESERQRIFEAKIYLKRVKAAGNLKTRVVLGKIPEAIFPCCRSVPVPRGIPSYLGHTVYRRRRYRQKSKNCQPPKSTVMLRCCQKSTGRKRSTVCRPRNAVIFQYRRQGTVVLRDRQKGTVERVPSKRYRRKKGCPTPSKKYRQVGVNVEKVPRAG